MSRHRKGRRSRLAGIVGALVLSAWAVSVSAVDDYLALRGTVLSPEDPSGHGVDVHRIDGVDYLDLTEVARLFRGTKYWRAELEKMVLKVNGHRVRLTVGSPYVFVDDVGRSLLAPVRWHEGRIVVPMSLVTGVLDELVTEKVTWDRGRRTLRVDTGDPNILDVDYDVRRNGTVVEIRLATPLRGRIEYRRSSRIDVRIPDGVLAPAVSGRFAAIGLLDSLVTIQEPGAAVLQFTLGPLGGTAELLARTTPPKLLLAVSEGLPDDIPLPEFERRGPGAPAAREVRRIVIDPGHGGSDPGIVASSGVSEKAVCLAIAQSLREMLEGEPDLEVHLTRDDDRFLATAKRTELANGWSPDLLVSIHCNGWFQPDVKGFSVGVHQGPTSASESDLRPWGTRSPEAARDSELLAEVVLGELAASLPQENRGLKHESYAMLEGATMPAVHVECGFLTNRTEESMLTDPGHQEGIAAALAFAIEEYRRILADGGESTP